MSQVFAYVSFVKEKLSMDRIVDLLREQQLHGEMPAAGSLHDLPDLAGLACHHVLEQAVTANRLFCHVRLPIRGS